MITRGELEDASTRRQGGYALVSVLWILGLLALAVSTMSVFTVNSLSVIASSTDRLAGDALLRAAVENSVMKILSESPKRSVSGRGQWRVGAGVARSSWLGESGRIDINTAPPILIANLIARETLDANDANEFTNIILSRRRDAAGSPPTLGPFRHVGELVLEGLPSVLLDRLNPYITIYSGADRLDPRLASSDVLSLLPDMTEARTRGLLALRAADTPDVSAWSNEAGPAAAALLSLERGSTARIRAEARLDNGFTTASEVVVIMYEDDKEPYRVLSWEDRPAGFKIDETNEGIR
jgi:general secretion pathway protein K